MSSDWTSRTGDDDGAARRRRLASVLSTAEGMRRISRRGFLWLGGSAALLAADMGYTRLIAEQRQLTRILPLADPAADSGLRDTGWFLLPGLKTSWDEATFILEALREPLNGWGRLAAVGYSNLGLDVDSVVDALARYIKDQKIRHVFLYGHSFGGMLAIEVAVLLRERHGIQVRFIVLDSTPSSKYDVVDQEVFSTVVLSYERGVPIPSLLRGGYELGERIVNKHERSWRQILQQTAEQLSPLAPSSLLVQSEAAYVYGFDVDDLAARLKYTELAFIGNPGDEVVHYYGAREGWRGAFPDKLMSSDVQTIGAVPAHASPQWSPLVYRPILAWLLQRYFPL